MDSIEKLNTAITLVEEARGVPLSASCVVHRSEMLEILDDSLMEEGRSSSEQMIASAREEVARMIEQTAIVQAARDEAQRILDDARAQAADERAEVESYIDGRLATLEVILNKTMDAVARGRDRLDGGNDKDVLSQLADDK